MSKPNYETWWTGKRCLVVGRMTQFKLVTAVHWIGPPSRVYGMVELVFDDGTTMNVSPTGAFKPRKTDVVVADR